MIKKILDNLTINSDWIKVSLEEYNNCYLIAIKDLTETTGFIPSANIKRIRFEVGIDSGITNKPVTISYFNVNFEDITSGNNEVNKLTAFTRLAGFPNEFYLRVSSVQQDFDEVTSGKVAISLNVNMLKVC